jgi:hypothetical protein
MEGPMREITFSQTHRRSHRQRHIVVSQFDDAKTLFPQPGETSVRVLSAGLAWHYMAQTGSNGPWTDFRRVSVALDATDDDVVMAVVRDLASLGWERDPAVVPVV